MTTTVKYFTSTMTGAPVLSNNWGDLTALLDACLVDGFGLKTADSVVVSGGIATATFSTGHPYQQFTVVTAAGATPSALNGEKRVLTIASNTITFDAAGVPDGSATGTITFKVSPLGWEKPYSGTNKGAYRSKNVTSPKNILLVDDSLKSPGYTTTWAKWANVGIVQDMSDIGTIVGAQAPFDPNRPTMNWKQVEANQWGWHKWYHSRSSGIDMSPDSGSEPKKWVLIGDDQMFYLMSGWRSDGGVTLTYFGDINSFKPGDSFHTALSATDSAEGAISLSNPGDRSGYGGLLSNDFTGRVLLRNHTQLGNPVRFGLASLNTSNQSQLCGRGNVPFPNGPDYSLWLLPIYVRQEDGHIRGQMPGMLWIPQDRPYSDLTVVDNVAGTPGKRFLLVRNQYNSETEGLQVAFDITGPWR